MAPVDTTSYPRPDFVRKDLTWSSLNGEWDFLFDDADAGLSAFWHRRGLPTSTPDGKANKQPIIVPYVFQTPASGINHVGAHEILWYERVVSDVRTSEQRSRGNRLLLRFGAVDYDCKIWADGELVGGHRGGHVPFDVDLTDVAEGKKDGEGIRVTLRTRDSPNDLTQPRGKQYWKPESEGIWYTPSGGIWQTVWLESVPAVRLGDGSAGTVLRSHDTKSGELHAESVALLGRRAGSSYSVEIEASLAGVSVNKAKVEALGDRDYAKLSVPLRLSAEQRSQLPESHTAKSSPSDSAAWTEDGLALWSPAHPQLYTLTIRLLDASGGLLDEVTTETGMRSLSWTNGDATFRLNGKPLFQRLVLDQGYWQDTGITPPSQEALKADIEMSMAMGFNGCRKHQKVEDPVFLYWADKLGYLVWGEIANAYDFDAEYARRFDQEWREAMMRDINHPSIITWTPINENWGYPDLPNNVEQRNHLRSLYWQSKSLDPTRAINENDGWQHAITDITTIHDYRDYDELNVTYQDVSTIPEYPFDPKKRLFLPEIPGVEPEVFHKPGAPLMNTEFGGINITPPKDAKAGEKDWGYTTASDSDDLIVRIERQMQALVQKGVLCAFVYTQLSDIEQEVNGLYSIDRRAKVDPVKMTAVMDRAEAKYFEEIKKKGVVV
jgi:beta-galactosidase/beta-glucuronidase